MYINDVHIIFYTIMTILGVVVAQFIDYCNKHEVVMIYTLMPHISY